MEAISSLLLTRFEERLVARISHLQLSWVYFVYSVCGGWLADVSLIFVDATENCVSNSGILTFHQLRNRGKIFTSRRQVLHTNVVREIFVGIAFRLVRQPGRLDLFFDGLLEPRAPGLRDSPCAFCDPFIRSRLFVKRNCTVRLAQQCYNETRV